MKNKFLMTAAFLSAFVASSAFADFDTAFDPVTTTTPVVKSGPYAGLDLGIASMAPASSSENNIGFTYDGFAGYDYVVEEWLTGLELGAGNKDSQNYTLSADLKAGRVMDRITVAYAKVGYGMTDLTKNGVTENFDGLRFGAGLEKYYTQNITGRIETIYTNYLASNMGGQSVDPTSLAVKLGVSYKF
jgi:hypothetical protein